MGQHQQVTTRISRGRGRGMGFVLGFLVGAAGYADTLFVDADALLGTDNGLTWTNAFISLQDGLAAAAAITASGGTVEIRVAAGIYRPDVGVGLLAGDRTATFWLLNNVALRGGFAGVGEPVPDARDVVVNETTLSGDLLGDSTGDILNPSRDEDSLHVVTTSGTSATARLDGLTISSGNADRAGDRDGAGILNVAGSPSIVTCLFTDNFATGNGGGMWSTGGSPTIVDCRFIGNRGDARGGGFAHKDLGSPTIIDCTFGHNSATFGGGVHSEHIGGSDPLLVGCSFVLNDALLDGGAVLAKNKTTVVNCVFVGNTANRGGGARGDATSGFPQFVNCTFSGNAAANGGGAVFSQCTGAPCQLTRVRNSILWQNGTDEITGSNFVINNSLVFGGVPPANGTDNIDIDPLFVNEAGPDNIPGTGDEDLRLTSASPAIDGGLDAVVPLDRPDLDGDGIIAEPIPFDFDGGPRFFDFDVVGDVLHTVDMGAFELSVTNTPPEVDLLVQQLTNIGETALVRFDGSASFDAVDPITSLLFDLSVDGLPICTGSDVECATVEIALPFGTHTATLRVTDTGGAASSVTLEVDLQAARLSVLEIERTKVRFDGDPGRIEMRGTIGLPFGVNFLDVAPLALVSIGLSDLVPIPPTPITFELSGDQRWRFDDPTASLGISRFDIDWQGARFQFHQQGAPLRLESQIISSDETVLTYRFQPRRFGGVPAVMDIAGLVTVEVDPDGNVTSSVPFEVERIGREVTLFLPFPLLETSVITISGGFTGTVNVADHFCLSLGRYRLDGVFDPALFPAGAGTLPRGLDIMLSIGTQFYDGEVLLDETDLAVRSDRWSKDCQ